ncbi:Pyridoxine 5'-phosphate synthase [Candidatus Arsenophonus lipoptenae]|uniref:Pyridoxine 5'-phosphate synthase n=1 Tax=Candidatus Arsenophonus lipoptenae TaxID=634113 RepID=A0A109Q9V2_9GAMM|nr:pyridoxine 5'-phosphate synthase [Candidatus Arsenophonus lipoptenae]AMA65221.1 Pyridoxine 5'-phosphate synthase [Candidatus Arsenophonus lipoptenae]
MGNLLLGVNIDHIATIRNARGTQYPDPIYSAFLAEQAGADGITVHLREDRRHITDRDVKLLRNTLQTKMNLEMAITNEMVDFACQIKPQYCCLVPERREELTTEGGLNVFDQKTLIKLAVRRLTKAGIIVSLFIDPQDQQIDAAAEIGVPFIELHTGIYANAKNELEQIKELERIKNAINYANSKQLRVNAGHGLTYHNVRQIAQLIDIYELNIGHAIIGRALFSGMTNAVRDMKKILIEARN